MDCKETQILLAPHILGDLEPDSRQCHELEAHLLSCQVCAEEYETNKWVVEFIQEHKTLFADAFETIEKKRAAEQEEIKRSWQAIQAKLVKIKAQEKRAKLRRVLWRATAAAACFVIGISVWLTLSNSKTRKKPAQQAVALVSAPSIKIELLSDNGNIVIPADTQVKTTASELKTLIINGKHRMVLNSDTALSIKPLLDNERAGCMVKLASGEIFAYVEHDNNPFVVSTAHSKVVIKGTIFDVKATDSGTTLVVSEGTVQFESEKGLVQVKSGQISRITAQSAPTEPAFCNAVELTAWARGHEIETALAEIKPFSDEYDLSDLWLSASSGRIDLEAIDYEDWVEKKRDWFELEFPWIFELKDALAKEGTDVDYHDLLLKSGDIWQFVYPQVSPSRIPVLSGDSLLKAVTPYGFGKEWLGENVRSARIATLEGRFVGLKAFEQWEADLGKASMLPAEKLDSGTLLCSLHFSTYLTNTRILAWLGLKNAALASGNPQKASVLPLLQTQVNTANELTGRIIRLFAISNVPCEEYQTLIDGIITHIDTITNLEKGIVEYEGHK